MQLSVDAALRETGLEELRSKEQAGVSEDCDWLRKFGAERGEENKAQTTRVHATNENFGSNDEIGGGAPAEKRER